MQLLWVACAHRVPISVLHSRGGVSAPSLWDIRPMLGWMYLTPAAQITFLVTGSLTAAALCWWVTSYGSPGLPTGYVAVSGKYRELERDRVFTAAKGIASTAVGFLTVLVTAFSRASPASARSLTSFSTLTSSERRDVSHWPPR